MTSLLDSMKFIEHAKDQYGFFDDFLSFTTAHEGWAFTTTTDGTGTSSDAAGGQVALLTAATTAGNEGACLARENENFKFVADKPLVGGARVQYAEVATDDANVFVGFINALAVTSMQDDGAGPPADYSGIGFHKVDGGTTWQFETSVGTSQTTTDTGVTAGGSAFQTLEFEVQAVDSTTLRAVPKIDGAYLYDSNNKMVTHTITLGTPTEMKFGIIVKDGSSTNEETLNVDWAYATQLR